ERPAAPDPTTTISAVTSVVSTGIFPPGDRPGVRPVLHLGRAGMARRSEPDAAADDGGAGPLFLVPPPLQVRRDVSVTLRRLALDPPTIRRANHDIAIERLQHSLALDRKQRLRTNDHFVGGYIFD